MNCLFCRIASGETQASIVFDDPEIMAFRDIAPQAPTHLLIIPKKHIATINDISSSDEQLLGRMMTIAKNLALTEGCSSDGYRLVYNVNAAAGQAVYHIHLHLLGGRRLTWPPG